MANVIREQRLIDSNKRSLIKYVILSDGTQESNTRLVDASNLAFALNANGYIMQSNTHPKSNYRTTVRKIKAFSKTAGSVRLKWEGDANSEIITFGTGTVDFTFENDGAVISNPEANATGDILISTLGLASTDAITIFLDLRKESLDYDAGQTADPYAFNAVDRYPA
jgi:hypothetical protein